MMAGPPSIGLPMPEALKGALLKLKDGKNDTAEGK